MSILEAITTHKNNTRAALTKEFGRIEFISEKLAQEELTSDDIKLIQSELKHMKQNILQLQMSNSNL
ncbi:hypothetical protein L1267_12320 [Pseudoalteromonas sp. OFAV1]|jgi:5-bromo-4-chloroindolyl phosphate hydrolysis protein|uniref:hypothetical protein n=1 Tax=Pseudoalteromonas sp. OFAV1 TaxID=2908892 RepID=UPI001F44C110|nr:hypothetical protein [Pseudoalteromonas sp. OFAV1]MCF2901177.1 hypothetical protein [Pseudoalteromonas sp. OFAV1]